MSKNNIDIKFNDQLLESESLLNNFFQILKGDLKYTDSHYLLSVNYIDSLFLRRTSQEGIYKSYKLYVNSPKRNIGDVIYQIELDFNGNIVTNITNAYSEEEKEEMKQPLLSLINRLKEESNYKYFYESLINKMFFKFNKNKLQKFARTNSIQDTFVNWEETISNILNGSIDFEKYGVSLSPESIYFNLEVEENDIEFNHLQQINKFLDLCLYSNKTDLYVGGINISFYKFNSPYAVSIDTYDLEVHKDINYNDLIDYATSKNILIDMDSQSNLIDMTKYTNNIDIIAELEEMLEIIQFKNNLMEKE